MAAAGIDPRRCHTYLNGKGTSRCIEATTGEQGYVVEGVLVRVPAEEHPDEHALREERRHGHVRVIEYAPDEAVLDVLPEGFEVLARVPEVPVLGLTECLVCKSPSHAWRTGDRRVSTFSATITVKDGAIVSVEEPDVPVAGVPVATCPHARTFKSRKGMTCDDCGRKLTPEEGDAILTRDAEASNRARALYAKMIGMGRDLTSHPRNPMLSPTQADVDEFKRVWPTIPAVVPTETMEYLAVDGPKLMAYIERLEAAIREMHVPGCFSAHGVACECGKDALEAAGYEPEEEGASDPPDPEALQRIFDAPAPLTLGDAVHVRLPGHDEPFFAEVTKAGAAPEVTVMRPGPVSVLPLDVNVTYSDRADGAQAAVKEAIRGVIADAVPHPSGTLLHGSTGKPVTASEIAEAVRQIPGVGAFEAMASDALGRAWRETALRGEAPRFGVFRYLKKDADGYNVESYLDLDKLVTEGEPEDVAFAVEDLRPDHVVSIIRGVARHAVPRDWTPLYRQLGILPHEDPAEDVAAVVRLVGEWQRIADTSQKRLASIREALSFMPLPGVTEREDGSATFNPPPGWHRLVGRIMGDGPVVEPRAWRLESLTTNPTGAVAEMLGRVAVPAKVVEGLVSGAPIIAIVGGLSLVWRDVQQLRERLMQGGADPRTIILCLPEGADLVRLVAVEGSDA